jgi:Asp-tRNA(Asn)/Glu-tRNA(Gln) amidotransferase A subunit family amidase
MTVVVPEGPCALDATQAASAISEGRLQPAELSQSCLDRVAARDALVHAWTHVDPICVGEQVSAGAATQARGALHGIPIGIKDVILTRDMPTGYNSPLERDCATGADAGCVAALRHAGALIFGKTDTVEFAAIGRPAMTRNPHDGERTPGGSSSGSAAAVADYHVPLALGTQTGGSIIRPASFCGVYGFKPSWGLVTTDGMKCFAPSLDTVGWFARSATDLALVLDVFQPPAPRPAAGAGRIALCRTPMWDHASPSTRAAMEYACRRFQDAGATVIEWDLPPIFNDLPRTQSIIMRTEGGRSMLPEFLLHGQKLHPALRGLVEDLDRLDVAALCAAYDRAALCRAQFDELAGAFDAVLAPSTVGEAPVFAKGTGDYIFNGLWTLLHVPCVNLPGFTTECGLPVGVTLTGPRFADRHVLDVAMRYWQAPASTA